MSAALERPGPSERIRAAARLAGLARYDEAELLLHEALAREPQDAWALHALGGVALARNDVETALRLIGAAATIRPDEPDFLANLANAHQQRGQSDEALICLERAVERAPGHAGIRRQRAELLLSLSRLDEAAAEAQRALEIDPDHVGAWVARGLAAVAQSDTALADACFREATALDAGCAEAWHNLAELHAADAQTALACAERAYLAKPGDPAQIIAYARRVADGAPGEAQALLKRARALAPDYLPSIELAARLDLAQGEERQALAELAGLVRRSGGKDPAALLALARILDRAGRFEQALQSVEQALALAPDTPHARALRNQCLFSLGRFDESWSDDATPSRTVVAVVIPAAMPLAEIILAARFLPRLAARLDGPLPVAAHPEIAPLLAGIPGVRLDDAEGAALGDSLLLSEVMAHLKIDAEGVAIDAPYLVPDPAALESWRAALAALPGPRIGILWHSGHRGIGLTNLLDAVRPLGTPVSLAIGDLRSELETHPETIDAGCRIAGPQDLAAVIAALDAVIAPDSIVAHLAGALGRPAVVFVPAGRHWAWTARARRSLWYPHTTVLTQAKAGDWSEIREALAPAVADLLASRAGPPGSVRA